MKLSEILYEGLQATRRMDRNELKNEIRRIRDEMETTQNPRTLEKMRRRIRVLRGLLRHEAEEYHRGGGLGRPGQVTVG